MAGESVRRARLGRAGLQTPARQQPPHPVPDGAEDVGHGLIAGRRRRVELEPARREFGEDAVQDQGGSNGR